MLPTPLRPIKVDTQPQSSPTTNPPPQPQRSNSPNFQESSPSVNSFKNSNRKTRFIQSATDPFFYFASKPTSNTSVRSENKPADGVEATRTTSLSHESETDFDSSSPGILKQHGRKTIRKRSSSVHCLSGRSQHGHSNLQPFDFNKNDCCAMDCWILPKNNVQNNDDSIIEQCFLQRLTCNTVLQSDEDLISFVYIFKTVVEPSTKCDTASFHLGLMHWTKHAPEEHYVYIPTRDSLQMFMSVLLCCDEYGSAKVNKNKFKDCPSTIGNMETRSTGNHSLREVVDMIPDLCNDEFLEEEFEKGSVKRGTLALHKTLRGVEWRYEGEYPKIVLPRKSPRKRVENQNSDSDSSEEEGETRTLESGMESSDEEDGNEENSEQDEQGSDGEADDFDTDNESEKSNRLKRKRTQDLSKEEPNQTRTKKTKHVKKTTIVEQSEDTTIVEQSEDTTIVEQLEVSNLFSDEDFFDENRINLETCLGNITQDQFIEQLTNVNEKLFDHASFKQILLNLIDEYLKQKKEYYGGSMFKFCKSDLSNMAGSKIKSCKVLTEEQQEDGLKRLFQRILAKLIQKEEHAVNYFKHKTEEWMETEQFKKDMLPKLLFDYMNSNREEYIEYAIKLYYMADTM